MAKDDDDLPLRKPSLEPRLLDPLSIEELGAYVAELEAEIARVRAQIQAKTSHRGAADSIFRR
jgi:uncharacterized small protein (DUF1192 family)